MRINVDCGEGQPWDAELAEFADMLNVCGGAHAGSREISAQTVALARANGLAWGMHPGYPDPEHFGRRPLSSLNAARVAESLRQQVEFLAALGGASYLKPHGAFYHDSQVPGDAADLLLEILGGLPLVGFPGSYHQQIAAAAGVEFWAEGFAERGYAVDGRLLPRSEPGALLTTESEIKAQVAQLRVDTICVHGDSPGCVQAIRWVREALAR